MAGIGRFQHTGAAPQTNLAISMGSGDTSFTAASGTGYPDGSVGDFVIAVDVGTATEEKILCSSRSGAVFTVAGSGRGYDNTSAAAHTAPTAVIEHVVAATEIDDASRHINPSSLLVYSDDHVNYALLNGGRPFSGAVSNSSTFTGSAMAASGLTGAANATRIVGATTGGPPATGTFATGDVVTDETYGMHWVCTSGGSPGTWIGSGTGQLMTRAYFTGSFNLSNSAQVIVFNNTTFDPLSAFNTGSGIFTVPVEGNWRVNTQINITATDGTSLEVIINHNSGGGPTHYSHASASTGLSGSFSDVFACSSSDTFKIQALVNTGTPALTSGSANTYVSFERIGG